jgi:hypothetical protein
VNLGLYCMYCQLLMETWFVVYVQVDLFTAEAYDLLGDFDARRHCGGWWTSSPIARGITA